MTMASIQRQAASDRPRKHSGTTAKELAILDATQELLKTVPLSDLSVAQIIEAAHVSRTSFYFYFSSKDAVVVALVKDVSREISELIRPLLDRGDVEPEEAVRQSLTNWLTVGGEHAAVLAAAAEEWPRSQEIGAVWHGVMRRVAEALARAIERERAAGVAPPGVGSKALASSLVWATERVFHVSAIGVPGLPSISAAVEPLVQMYMGAIYGRPLAQVGSSKPRRTKAKR
jgi:AcrR family transcriptional regulator